MPLIKSGSEAAKASILKAMFNLGPDDITAPRIVHAAAVKDIGHGDMAAGRRVLKAFIALTRKKRMKQLNLKRSHAATQ
jgi:hypothetical protein